MKQGSLQARRSATTSRRLWILWSSGQVDQRSAGDAEGLGGSFPYEGGLARMRSARMGDRQMKDGSKYDLVVKDLFQRDHPSLLDQLTAGVAVRAVLSVELARVEERRADLVLLLADESISHIEFQSGNDKDIPFREGIYCLLLGQKYRRRVRQVVLYLGQAKMRVEDRVDLGETKVAYRLMDIREMDARTLMASGRPGDLALAMLASGGPEQ